MEIIFSNDKQEYNFEFKKNIILFGNNSSGKTKLLKELVSSIKNGTSIINALKNQKNEYDIIFFSEETDFNDEFSFTKSNIFRATIYDSIMNSINKEKLLKEVNLTFDKIDKKVNTYLNKNINQFFDNNIKFDINIDDLDNIINKFTSVYINDLNDSKKVPKSFKRMLLYQLALLNYNNKDKFIVIDDFDLYMDCENMIKILDFISKYSSETCHFIISTSNPLVYNYLNDDFDIYKVANHQIYKLTNINNLIQKAIIMNEYEKSHELITFDEFYNKNISLINNNDINNFYKNHYIYLKKEIGIILTSNCVYLNYADNNKNFIITRNKIELYFLKFLCEELLTDYQIIDIL